MKTRVQAHTSYRLLYHVVWIPKYRRKVLVSGIAAYCDEVIRSVAIDRYPDVFIEELNVRVDHVHMILVIPPKYSISTVIGRVKSDTSRKLRAKFDYLSRNTDALWSIGYFVSSVGLDEARIRHYVQFQEEQDTGRFTVAEPEATGTAERRP